MKRLIIALPLLIASLGATSQSVGIGTTSPNSNAVLDITSSNKVLIIPRLTTTAINAISHADGMLVYNSNFKAFFGYSSGGIRTAVSQASGQLTANILQGENIGQSFTAPKTSKLGIITVTAIGVSAGGGQLWMRVLQGNGYGGTELAAVYPPSFTSSAGDVNFDFTAQNISLIAGSVYTFIIYNLSSWGHVGFQYHYTSDIYPSGNMYHNNVTHPSQDMVFRIDQVISAGWKQITE